jgi:SAM-dependent methyltransferase
VSSTTTPLFGIDKDIPAPARIYDFWLGGHDNFAADRIAALKVTEAAPEAPLLAIENRKFLRRVVRYLAADAGIAQFLDIGTGLPTQGNVHQIAQEITPDAHVVYVDNDPMVLAHSKALKTGPNVAVIQSDLRDPAAILQHPVTRQVIDFSQPLAVLLIAVLHFVSNDDDPAAIVASIRDALPGGSYLAVSHVTGDIRAESAARAAVEYKKILPDATLRSRAEILRFFDGFDQIDPGLVPVPHWRPDKPEPVDADKVWILGGIGRKPGR